MKQTTKVNIFGSVLLILAFGVLLGFCTYLSSVPVGEPSNGTPVSSSQDDDDDLGPINRELGLGTNEIDDFLGL